ncbi:MAG: hypothetical protein PHI34_14105 [Acidobacteriota bacterium]|nr:hypothetical protein [Acidobacteriota bacterium]
MTPKGDALDESTTLIREIESGLETSLRQKREQIERELEARLQREREESKMRLATIEKEFEKEKGNLREYHEAVTEFESARDGLESEIRERLDRSAGFQREIEKMTSQTGDELRIVAELSGRLADLRISAEQKIGEIRARLKERFPGAVVEAEPILPPASPKSAAAHPPEPGPAGRRADVLEPASVEDGEFVFDLEKELGKLKKIKEMLDQDGPAAGTSSAAAKASFLPSRTNAVPAPSEVSLPPGPEEGEWPLPPQTEPEKASEFHMPEINQFVQDFVRREQGLMADAPAAASSPLAPADDTDFNTVFTALERYRRSEPTDYSGEISFFQNRDHLILDGESLLRAMDTITAEARKLFGRLGQAGTPKEQFFIKQELINNQEILRKIILRSVRMCERESCRLPRYTEGILNPGVLKDLLERLNMDNWSNQEDFAAFEATSNKLKDAFHRRITPPAKYLHSIIQELEG